MKSKFLQYSKNERWGILTLAMLNLALLLIAYTFSYPRYQFSEKELEAFRQIVTQDTDFHNIAESRPARKDSLFAFNPNTADREALIALGLPERAVTNLIKYRSRGGRIENPEDLSKIYGMDDETLRRVAPFVNIPQRRSFKKPATKKSPPPVLFAFDPNTATEAQLKKLGFSPRARSAIINYRKRGGHFSQKKDLKKIYDMTPELYQKLMPYISIATPPPPEKSLASSRQALKRNKKYWPPNKSLEINAASEEDWRQLPGIGKYFARNIVRYRNKLGGFYSIEQVAETYRLPDSTFQKIKNYLVVDTSKIRKINPQLADFKTLVHHPYISYEQTRAIMRAQRGYTLHAPEDLLLVKIFTEKELKKVLPYFEFTPRRRR